jgi:HEPN domain-containing protein
MKKATEAWIKKAEGDFRMMKSLMATNDEAQFDGVCYHAQQCVEKLLKALCIDHDLEFPRTHDLQKLFEVLRSTYAPLSNIKKELEELTELGAEFRYPDEFASGFEATRALDLCVTCRKSLLEILGPVEGTLFP